MARKSKPDIREIIAEFKSRRCRGRLASCGEIAAIAEALLREMDRRDKARAEWHTPIETPNSY